MRFQIILLTAACFLAAAATQAEPGRSQSANSLPANLRTLIAQALDQNTDLAVQDQPLRTAFEQISEQTGVKIEIDPASVDLLPYGADTRVSATVKGVPLRQGLAQLISPIGMAFEVRDDRILVRATPVLARINRRATWNELALIQELTNKPFPSVADALAIQFQVETVSNPHADLLGKTKNVGHGTAAEVLDIAARSLGWTWYPWDRQIVVVTREQQAMRQLDKRFDLNYRRHDIGHILIDLADLARLDIKLDPGALNKLPVQSRESFSLVAESYSIRQALELICGNTGLEYHLKGGTVTVTAGPSLMGDAGAAATRYDPYVGKVNIKGKDGQPQFEFLLRESDLPPDLNKLRKDKIKEAIDNMRQDLTP